MSIVDLRDWTNLTCGKRDWFNLKKTYTILVLNGGLVILNIEIPGD